MLWNLSINAAAAKLKITGLSPAAIGEHDIHLGDEIHPGEVHRFVINDVLSFFEYEGVPTDKNQLMSLLKTADISARQKKGESIIKAVKWDNAAIDSIHNPLGSATVCLEFIDPYVSVVDLEFEIVLFFAPSEKRTDERLRFLLRGTFGNPVTEVYSDTARAGCFDDQVSGEQESVEYFQIELGEEVFATIRMDNDKKIYAKAYGGINVEDAQILEDYPTVYDGYVILSVGLSSQNGNFIELRDAADDAYVYGLDSDHSLFYLGRGGELLPFSAKYFISSEKIWLDAEPENILG